MSKRTDAVRALPQGVVVCGWCDAAETCAKLAIAALDKISGLPCDCTFKGYESGQHATQCHTQLARNTLSELRLPEPQTHTQPTLEGA